MEKQIISYINAFKPEKHVLSASIFLAKELEVPLQLHDVTVFPHVISSDMLHARPTGISTGHEMMLAAEQKMDKLVSKIRKEKWLYTSHSCQVGFPAEALPEYANEMLRKEDLLPPYLLIIENASGQDWLNKIFGTVETSVAKKSDVPVLLIPNNKPAKFNKIVHVFRNGYIEMPQAVKTIRLASDLGAQVEFLMFSKAPSDTDLTTINLESNKLLRSAIINNMDVSFNWADRTFSTSTLLEEVSNRKGTLLAFKHDNENYLESLMKQDSSRDLILAADIPTLIY